MRWGLTKNNFSDYSLPKLLPSRKVSSPRLGFGAAAFSPGQPAGSGRSHKPARLGGPRRGVPPAGRSPTCAFQTSGASAPAEELPGRSPALASSDTAQPPPSAQPGPARRSAVSCAPHTGARTPELTKPPEPRATSRCRAARPASPAPA